VFVFRLQARGKRVYGNNENHEGGNGMEALEPGLIAAMMGGQNVAGRQPMP